MHRQTNYPFHIILLFCLSIIPYSGTINHGWHLDDHPNISYNNAIHISDLHPNTLSKTFFAHPVEPGRLFRPVANLSFGINWFFGQQQSSGYRIVNISIHFLTAVALYLSCILLLQSPVITINNLRNRETIAILTASLWVLAPIHTQAVSYIVQRMAQLATLFSISAILFFLLLRLTTNKNKRIIFTLCCLACVLLAMGSKENSILLPFSLLLIEFIFFARGKSIFQVLKNNIKKNLIILLIAISGIIFIAVHYGANLGLLNYDHRSFSLLERLLTEPRILLFYLSQIIVPTASRLSIEHDIIVSTSLFTPWNTLPAIALCTGLIILGLCRIQKNPLFSFAILFFFLNHIVESTFIHLELLFEHRNYLPSLFLFLPIAAYIVTVIDKVSISNKFTRPFLVTACTGFLIMSGASTYERNKAWFSELSLWEDANTKAPESPRAKLSLAKSYINQDRHQEALKLCEQAEKLTGATRNKLVPVSLSLKGSIAYKDGNLDKAVMYFQDALSLRSDFTDVVYKLIALLIELERYEEALAMVTTRYEEKKEPKLLLIKASLLLRLNKPVESINTYHIARLFYPASFLITTGEGKALSMLGHYKQADMLLDWAVKNNEPDARMIRIENSLLAESYNQANKMLDQLIKNTPYTTLLSTIEAPQKNAYQIPFDSSLVYEALMDVNRNRSFDSTSTPDLN